MTLTDMKVDQMVTNVQQFVSRIMNGDTVIKLTFEQLIQVLDISSTEFKADNTAAVRLQESLMLSGISFVSLPTIQKADDQKTKKFYYLFRDNHSMFEEAVSYTDDEFIAQLKDNRTTYFDIKNLERLNLPLSDLAPLICKSIGHSRLSTSKHGKCVRCGSALAIGSFSVVVSQEGKIGTPKEFRPIDRLDWRDLVGVQLRWLGYISKSAKFDRVVDVQNSHGIVEQHKEPELTEEQKGVIFKTVMEKKGRGKKSD